MARTTTRTSPKPTGMLTPYRVLDLTDEQGFICGKILGDLGADVIKIEPPGGEPSRNIGPFYHDEPDPEKSLHWFALNTSKRGITLDISKKDGQEIFKKMVKSTDFVIESFAPGCMEKLGLGYKDLDKLKPGIIMVSISPFGQSGPYRDLKSSDLISWAMSGEMEGWGEPDRPPVRISGHSQTYLNAGTDGAIGALIALYQRWQTMQGQQIDVSIQESISIMDGGNRNPLWVMSGGIRKRGDPEMGNMAHRQIRIWKCKDGWVSWSHGGVSVLAPSLPLIKWMDKEGVTNDFIKNFDWTRMDFAAIPQEEMDQIDEATSRFFMVHTKSELLEGAVKYEVMLYPVFSSADFLGDIQLKERGFWVDIDHPELGAKIRYPGAFGVFSEAGPTISRRAPLIGEHNEEIYVKELGMSKETLLMLMQNRTI